ncbi:MAG: DUF58 domain-containing protein [Congregibacter sp.]
MPKSSNQHSADDRVAASLAYLSSLEHQARGFSFLPRQPAQSILAGRHASRLRGRGLSFEEIRHYRPGDDIRSMDWKVTNRTRKPHVRVYTEERERQVHLIVDQRTHMFFGSERAMKSVAAAELAALAAWRVLAAGDRLGATVFNDEKCFRFAAQNSRATVLRLLSRLAACNADLTAANSSCSEQLPLAIDTALRTVSHDALILLISDADGWETACETLVGRARRHNDVVMLHVRDRGELNLPARDDLVVSDGSLQIAVNTRRSALQESFKRSQLDRHAKLDESLRRLGVPLLAIDACEPTLEQVIRALGGRQ